MVLRRLDEPSAVDAMRGSCRETIATSI